MTLYERGPRGIIPTEFGLAFTEHARAVLAQLRQAGRHMDELAQANRGTVVVGSHLVGLNYLLPRAIVGLKKSRPHLTVILREGPPDRLRVDLEAGRIDLMVGRLPQFEEEKVEHEILLQDHVRLTVASHHPLTGAATVSIDDLIDRLWVVPTDETVLRQELNRFFNGHGFGMPTNRVETTSFRTVRQLLLDTDAIAALPSLLVRGDAEVAQLPLRLDTVGHHVGITLAQGRRLSPAVQAMRVALHQAADEIKGFTGDET